MKGLSDAQGTVPVPSTHRRPKTTARTLDWGHTLYAPEDLSTAGRDPGASQTSSSWE